MKGILRRFLGGRPPAKTREEEFLPAVEDLRPVFVCGVAGSGTTLLGALLDQNFANALCLHESSIGMPEGAALAMRSVVSYGTVAEYRRALPLPDDVSPERVRSECRELWRARMRGPVEAPVVLDKAANTHLVRAARFKEAFPDARFVFVVRDPVENVEGLRRKWKTFAAASLDEICDFWESLHDRFERDVAEFESDVASVAFEELAPPARAGEPDAAAEARIGAIARFLSLSPRARPKPYEPKPDVRGKGLRNVRDGKIVISREATHDVSSLSPEEIERVNRRLRARYESLKARTTPGAPPSAGESRPLI